VDIHDQELDIKASDALKMFALNVVRVVCEPVTDTG
jgi:hypothetical protein